MAETAAPEPVFVGEGQPAFQGKAEELSPVDQFADAVEDPTMGVGLPSVAAHKLPAAVAQEEGRGEYVDAEEEEDAQNGKKEGRGEEENGAAPEEAGVNEADAAPTEPKQEEVQEEAEERPEAAEGEEVKEEESAAGENAEEADKSLKFFVGGVNPQATELQIRSYFERFGKVKVVELKMDKMTGRNRGFCFVTMANDDAKDAIFNTQHVIGAKKVEVRALHDDGNVSLKKKIFVGGVNPSLGESDVEKYFSKFGTVDKVSIIRDSTTGKSRGFGFVVFATEESAKEVLKSRRHNLTEKDNCEVRAAESRASLPPPRSRYMPVSSPRAPGLLPPGPRYPPAHAVTHQPPHHVPPPASYYAPPPRSPPAYYYGPPPPVAPAAVSPATASMAYYSSSLPAASASYAASTAPYYSVPPATGVAAHTAAAAVPAASVMHHHPQAAGAAPGGATAVVAAPHPMSSTGYYASPAAVPYDATGATAAAATATAARGYWDEEATAGAAAATASAGAAAYYGARTTASPAAAVAAGAAPGYTSGYSPVRQSPYYGAVGRSNVRRSPY
ncbi:RNA recognition motif-containing protein [Besnoitia besnoiti]|uniref:RNA recognition motif-containing protein n=1 Tax=Besnoitia besnoiti TaxID=94643 RepID=A0A2A9MDV5_BESBE|nr:RNA recognition motif-containing protein [Besnoitia besnoiti]PFH36688.1 RNA recognition motif-containing protein [Besnoitia besnoiti]